MRAIDRNEALRYLGYRGQALTEELSARIDGTIERCQRDFRPDGTFALFPVRAVAEGERPRVELAGANLTFEGVDIVRHLRGAREVAVMAVTLGARSERELQRLSAIDPLEALVFDAACSAYVEAAADEWEDRVVHAAVERGLVTNWRYSPGYGDFPLAAQPAIVRALRADVRLGLSALESHLLVPTKSVTAVIGLFESKPAGGPESPCVRCKLRAGCEMRKRGVVCHGRTR